MAVNRRRLQNKRSLHDDTTEHKMVKRVRTFWLERPARKKKPTAEYRKKINKIESRIKYIRRRDIMWVLSKE